MQEKKLVIKKENIVYDLEANNIGEVIDSLAKKLYENQDIKSIDKFKQAVIQREKEVPTSIGKEIAIPHGKSNSIRNSTVALGVLNKKIKWGEENNDEVKYVFLLAIREDDQADEHLRILADLSTNLMDDEFVGEFKSAKNKNEVFKVINKIN